VIPFNLFSALSAKIFGGIALVLLAFATIQTIRIEGVWCGDGERPKCLIRGFKQELRIIRINLAEAEANARAEAAKHKATKEAYIAAQAKAAEMEAARIARVVARQQEITDEVKTEYRRQLAAVRARANRLRAQLEASGGGGSGSAPGSLRMPEASEAPAGADEAPDCQAFPARDALTEIRCREIAEQQAHQLDALITWVEKQLRLEP
jgi:hypothetical protein